MSHMEKDSQISDQMRSLASVLNSNLKEHPHRNRLVLFHEGKLTPEEVETIQDHLALCPACTKTVLEYASFSDLSQQTDGSVPDEGMHGEWHRFKATLEKEKKPKDLKYSIVKFPLVNKKQLGSVLAAALLVIVVGLSVWINMLNQKLSHLSQPNFSDMLVDLAPGGMELVQRGEIPDQKVLFYSKTGNMLLLLNRAEPWPPTDIRITILSEAGEALWKSDSQIAGSTSTFTLSIPRNFLRPGQYKIRLESTKSEVNMIETYVFFVEYN